MPAGYAILCPGQGAQHAGMFDLVRQDARAAGLLQLLGPGGVLGLTCGQTLDDVLSDEQLLFANRYAQPLIVAAGLAAWQCLRDDLPAPALVAGYSVGEVTACGVAGMWPAGTALELARVRAGLMDACLQQVPQQGLMAVSGLPLSSVAQQLTQKLTQWQLHVAIVTGFDTLIAGGPRGGLLAAQAELSAAGARCSMLPVGIASHTPLMAPARALLAGTLDSLPWQTACVPVIAGVSGVPAQTPAQVGSALLQQLTDTIQWSACMDTCAERGVGVALELGPGSALSRMLAARHPQIECRSLADFRSAGAALLWLQRHLD